MAEPDRTVYQQPSVRQCTTWTPPLVRLIKAQADSGQLQRIADLCDDMLSDDRILGVLSTLADSLLGVNLGFDDGARRGRRKKVTGEERSDVILALEDDGDWWELCSEDQARQVIIWCKLIGYCPGQLVWPTSADYQRGGRVVPRLEFWHPRTLRWDPQLRAWFIRVGDDGTEVPFMPGDGKWVLFTIGGQWRPWSNGVWRGLALLYLLKSYAKDDLGKLGANAARAVATDDEDHDRGEVRTSRRRSTAPSVTPLSRCPRASTSSCSASGRAPPRSTNSRSTSRTRRSRSRCSGKTSRRTSRAACSR